AEHATDDAVRVEHLEVVEVLAAADEGNRHAHHRHHRERRAAAGVAIELGEHHAGDTYAAVELAGALDRVLPRHRVGDVEEVGGLHGLLDLLELVHQVVVDVQTTRGVHDYRVEALGLGVRQRAGGAGYRVHRLRAV